LLSRKKRHSRDYVDETLDKVRNRNCFIEYENPPDEILAGLYSKKKPLCFSLLFEGFGLPVYRRFALANRQ
jgi:hypothetical protein